MSTFKPKTDLQPRQNFEIGAPIDLSQYAKGGLEDVTINDLPRPTLKLLQGISPECTDGHADFIDGARPGMFYSTANNQLYSADGEYNTKLNLPPLLFVPVLYRNREIEYKLNRGGFVSEHLPGSEITKDIKMVQEKKRFIRVTKNETELVDTSIYFGLVLNHETNSTTEVVLSLSSTGKKFSKKFNSYMTNLRDTDFKNQRKYEPPCFSRLYTFSSMFQPNGNESYFSWKFNVNTKLDSNNELHHKILTNAIEYRNLINTDQVKVDHNLNTN